MGEDGATVGLKGDSWSGSINTCDQLGARGKMGVFQMKKAHSLYQKKKETTLSGIPGGVHIISEGTHLNGQRLIALGHSIGLPL